MPSQPCAQALLVVAHPDDETLWAGEALLGQTAFLPGGCRNAAWHVVCATNGGLPHRRRDLKRALDRARLLGLAASITSDHWDFEDCDHPECATFPGGTGGPSLRVRLARLLQERRWDYVVTHNAQGEYGHNQHIGLHQAVSSSLGTATTPILLVFNPLPELNVSASPNKQDMLDSYLAGPAGSFHPNRPKLLAGLGRYTEHLAVASDFARPEELRIIPFDIQQPTWMSGYWYKWNLFEGFEGYGPSNASLALERFLRLVRSTGCGRRPTAPAYSAVCVELARSGGRARRARHLVGMQAASSLLR